MAENSRINKLIASILLPEGSGSEREWAGDVTHALELISAHRNWSLHCTPAGYYLLVPGLNREWDGTYHQTPALAVCSTFLERYGISINRLEMI